MNKPPTRYRPTDPREAAEQAFKAATTKPAPTVPAAPLQRPTLSLGSRETVAIKLDRDILDHFQADGPGWQERINAALRKAIEAVDKG
jgi:uncharacterized protein (DUF4415 family)